MTTLRITHGPTGQVLAEGPRGFAGITPFEGNYYIRRKYLRTDDLRVNWVPGICPYKFLYVWMDLKPKGAPDSNYLAWMYWLPNPLLPFIWWRVALSGTHPELQVQELEGRS